MLNSMRASKNSALCPQPSALVSAFIPHPSSILTTVRNLLRSSSLVAKNSISKLTKRNRTSALSLPTSALVSSIIPHPSSLGPQPSFQPSSIKHLTSPLPPRYLYATSTLGYAYPTQRISRKLTSYFILHTSNISQHIILHTSYFIHPTSF